MLRTPHNATICYVVKFKFITGNNEAECEALITSLKPTKDMGTENLKVHYDSMLIVQQVNGNMK